MPFPARPSDHGPPEPAWLECSGCCDWARADGARTPAGEPLCADCAEVAAEREADVVAGADALGIGVAWDDPDALEVTP